MNFGCDFVEKLSIDRAGFLISSLQISGTARQTYPRHQLTPLGISPFHRGIHIRAGLILRYQTGHQIEIIIVDVLGTHLGAGDKLLVQLVANANIPIMGVVIAGIRLESVEANL